MSILVFEAGDAKADNGEWARSYPIPEHKDEYEDIIYDKMIQRNSYILANIVGVFTDWFKSFFPDNYFRTERIKTQSSFADFKSFMRGIYKKDKPTLVIDPSTIESMEESIFGQNMLNRYNLVDPDHDNIGAKMIYSRDLMRSDLFELVFRRNRYRFEINVMIMEQTMDRAINTYNMMLMNIRHNSKFMLHRTIPCIIPMRYIDNIARFHGFDRKTEGFLKFLNSICEFPVIKRITPDGQTMFMFNYELNIQVEVPGFPQRDNPEMSEAIEWGSRVVDSFTFIADLPAEFLYLMPKNQMTQYDKSTPKDPDGIYLISPVYADLDWPKEINGYKLTNRADIMLDDGDKSELNIISVLSQYNMDLYSFVTDFIKHGQKLSDLVMVQVYPNGSYTNIASNLNDNGILELIGARPNKLYTANIYVNFDLMNMIKKERGTEYVGTMEKNTLA